MKRWKFIALFAVLALLVVACGDEAGEVTTTEGGVTTTEGGVTTTEGEVTTTTEAPVTTAPQEKTVIIGTTDAISSLDNADAYAVHDWELLKNIGEGLLKWEPGTGDQLVPGIAQDMGSFSEDGLSYTIQLQEGIAFGDGTPLDAQAYADYINQRLLVLEGSGGVGPALGQPYVASVEAVDALTIKFNLTGTYAFFPEFLASAPYIPSNPVTYPMDELNPFPAAPIYGTGPWFIETYVQGEQMVLKPNPLYHGEAPALDQVIIRYFGDPQTMALAVQNGEIDIAWRILGAQLSTQMEEVEGLTVATINAGPIRYLIINHVLPPTNDANVRKAIAWLIDRDEMSDRVFGGKVEPLYSPVPPGFLGATEPFLDLYPGPNVDEANALLEASGYSEENPLVLDFWYPPEHYGDTTADQMEVLAEQIERSGLIDVNLNAQEWSTYIGATTSGDAYPVAYLGWFYDYPDPDNYMSPFIQFGGMGTMVTDPDTGEVIEGLDPDLLSLLMEAASTADPAERATLYAELQEIYADIVVTLPLFIEAETIVYRDGIMGSTDYASPETLNIGPTVEFNYKTLDVTG